MLITFSLVFFLPSLIKSVLNTPSIIALVVCVALFLLRDSLHRRLGSLQSDKMRPRSKGESALSVAAWGSFSSFPATTALKLTHPPLVPAGV